MTSIQEIISFIPNCKIESDHITLFSSISSLCTSKAALEQFEKSQQFWNELQALIKGSSVLNETSTSLAVASAFLLAVRKLCDYDGEPIRDGSTINKENAKKLVATTGVCDLTVRYMNQHYTDADAAYNACFAVASMNYEYSDDTTRKILGDLGACEAVVKSLRQHCTADSSRQCQDIATQACRAIAYLSYNSANRVCLGSAGACEAVVEALRKHAASSEKVAEYGCWAVGMLSYKDANVTRFKSISDTKKLLEAVRDNPAYSGEDAEYWAKEALRNLGY